MKSKLSVAKVVLVLLVGIGLIVGGIYYAFPSLLIFADNGSTLTETIVDHRRPKRMYKYTHTGQPQLLVSKVFLDKNDKSIPNIVWCKVFDKQAHENKSFWTKLKERIVGVFRFMSFDENGAFVLTDRGYAQGNEISAGSYIYIGALKVTLHVEGYGTGIWEFPGYIDMGVSADFLNSLLKQSSEEDIIRNIQSRLYSCLPPAQSYKIKKTDRGATLSENLQPWLDCSYDISIEFLGDGAFAQ